MNKRKTYLHLLLLAAVIVLAGWNLQGHMLYYPDSYIPSPEFLAREQIQFWPDTAAEYRGFAGPAPDAPRQGTIIVFHGNAGSAAERTYYRKALTPLGFQVILAEYPGYGARKGKPGETSFVKDGRETLQLVFEQYGGPLYLAGESLGAAVAAAILKESPVPVNGIILITPWDTLPAVAAEKFPWLPVRLLLRDRYDTVHNLKSFHGKAAILAAELDEIIPPGHAKALFQGLAAEKRIWMIRGAGHNDWPEAVDRPMWEEISAFLTGGKR